MKFRPPASLGIALMLSLLLALITWLLAFSMNPAASRYDQALGVLDKFEMTTSNLERNVLSARMGLLRDYDPLAREVDALDTDLYDLRALGVDSTTANALAALVGRQESLVEQFTTDNALLQNVLAHFELLGGQLDLSGKDKPLAPAMTNVLIDLLRLTLDTSPASSQAVVVGLDDLMAQSAPGDRDLVHALQVQGYELREILPETDGTIQALYQLPTVQLEEAARADIVAHQHASRAVARLYRCLLYIVSLSLVGLLLYLGHKLRGRIRAQQRRASFEHAIAGISMRFLSAAPGKHRELVVQALAELAHWVNADRAYFLGPGALGPRHIWHATTAPFPANWPDKAFALAPLISPARNGIIHILNIGLKSGDRYQMDLREAGLCGWVCISVGGSDNTRYIIGFDAVHRPLAAKADDLAFLQMASDVIANAIARDSFHRERVRLEATLQQARRMETVGALASGVAHNFNNIIGAILGHAEMAAAQLPSDGYARRHLDVIRQAGERAGELVDQILAFGRRRDPMRRPVQIRQLLAETEALAGSVAQSGTTLVVEGASAACIVSGVPTDLQQVILNLYNNAMHATDEDGTITVSAEMRTLHEETQFTNGRLASGQYVCIAVCDDGRGMDTRTQEQIFEPFFTTRQSGNGLGLATVRAIVNEHGGAINVISAVGEGSIFEVWLPNIVPDQSDLNLTSSTLSRGHGETIMVIDDVLNQRLKNEEIVAALGYEPVGFSQIDEALDALKAAPIRFDSILITHLAPIAAALEFAVKLRGFAPHLPILLVASPDEISADILTEAGIREIIPRTLATAELACALKRSLDADLEADTDTLA